MSTPFFITNFRKINFSKAQLSSSMTILLFLLVIYFIFQYIWVRFFISISLKNYLNFFLWNFINISYPIIVYSEVFKAVSSKFGYVILLNEHSTYWYVELQWIIEQFLINQSGAIIYNTDQIEILVLHIINNFLFKLEKFFSFGTLFVMMVFFHFIISFYGDKNLTHSKVNFKRKNLTEANSRIIFIRITVDFLLFMFVPIILFYFIFYLIFYIYRINPPINKIIFTHKWPSFFLIVSNINANLLSNKDVLFIKEKIKSKHFDGLKHHRKNILMDARNIFKFFFFKKNELISMVINSYNSKITSNSPLGFYLFLLIIKSYVFYFTKLLNYLIILISLSSRFKLINFCVDKNQFFYTLKKFNSLVLSKFLLWKPLFKRWSYYGFFSKTRTYWSRFSLTNAIKF